jgi:hypothetical protein
MLIFLESPWPWIFLGIVAEAVLATMLVTMRQAKLLWWMLGALVFMIAGVVVERLVVTERERVEAAMEGIVAALNANDLPRLLNDYIAPNAAVTRARASWALGRIHVQRANYHNLRVTINRLTSPITADAEFDGGVDFRDQQGEFPYGHYRAHFVVELELRDGRWLVTDHVEYDMFGGQHQEERY